MSISYKRIAVCYFLIVSLLFICAFRVFAIMSREDYKQAAEQVSRRVITLDNSRGTIFDTNMNRLTNTKEIYYAVIFDEPKAMATLYNYMSSEEINSVAQEIRQNGFALRPFAREIVCDGIYSVKAYMDKDDSLLAKHIIGYTDSLGAGVCGLESSFEEMLKCEDKNQISFSVNGQGKVITGYNPELSYNYEVQNSGIKTTINKEIQQITEQQAMKINCGAVVVCEISTGKIRALVSRPDYKLTDLASALENQNEPLLNRALCTYNIGSVFKPLIAAAGYEEGKSLTIDCKGYVSIDGLTFACHKLGGHGEVNLSTALKFSCNSFFYNFIQSLSMDSVFRLSKLAGINSEIFLCDNLSAKGGNLGSTNINALTKRELANISIGQGQLLTSPIAITNLYMAIASGGSYRMPSLIEGRIEDGTIKEETLLPKKVKLFSGSTANKLKADLLSVLDEDGTGKAAKPKTVDAAGKTGTAQTGVIKGGKKVTNSWFCGFFPFDNPKYAVTVLSENAKGGCGDIFAGIADGITQYEINRQY